ncbi:MAG: hypothetical protein AAF393_12815 [Pseudomonadota bacterium]
MKIIASLTAAFVAAAVPLSAGEFSEGSKAKEWGLLGEEKALFSGKVVDVLCEVSGNCTDDCGGGRRQLGILRDADGALVYVLKNSQAAFSGAATDLYPYCGKEVEVDGVTVHDEEVPNAPKLYMVQLIREKGAEKWNKANRWTKEWAKAHPEEKKAKGPWFRKDPRVKAAIATDGYLGLGLEIDKAFIKENFE